MYVLTKISVLCNLLCVLILFHDACSQLCFRFVIKKSQLDLKEQTLTLPAIQSLNCWYALLTGGLKGTDPDYSSHPVA